MTNCKPRYRYNETSKLWVRQDRYPKVLLTPEYKVSLEEFEGDFKAAFAAHSNSNLNKIWSGRPDANRIDLGPPRLIHHNPKYCQKTIG